MYSELCLCDVTPRLELRTRVVIFMHRKEYPLITNTGVLARRVLTNSRIVYRGHPDRRIVGKSDFSAGAEEAGNAFILYPAGEAVELNDVFLKKNPGPLTLICPDGHWSQAKKIVRHEPALKNLPCLKLPEGLTSHYRLRRNPVPGRVCTFEAVAMALELIEGRAVREQMDGIFEKMVTRILWTRGKIPADQVEW
jgi:DTW domain-containing protein YfiP